MFDVFLTFFDTDGVRSDIATRIEARGAHWVDVQENAIERARYDRRLEDGNWEASSVLIFTSDGRQWESWEHPPDPGARPYLHVAKGKGWVHKQAPLLKAKPAKKAARVVLGKLVKV